MWRSQSEARCGATWCHRPVGRKILEPTRVQEAKLCWKFSVTFKLSNFSNIYFPPFHLSICVPFFPVVFHMFPIFFRIFSRNGVVLVASSLFIFRQVGLPVSIFDVSAWPKCQVPPVFPRGWCRCYHTSRIFQITCQFDESRWYADTYGYMICGWYVTYWYLFWYLNCWVTQDSVSKISWYCLNVKL